MKKLAYILFFLALPAFGYSQMFQQLPNFYRPIDPSAIEKPDDNQSDKVDFGLTVGTGFTSFGGNSMMNSYLAPNMAYKVNSKLTVNVSGIISNMNQFPFSGGAAKIGSPSGSLMPMNTNNNSYAISAGGVYKPNERFYIKAQGQYADNSMSPFSLYQGQNRNATDYSSLSLGMGYKISEKASIDFEFRVANGYNNLYNPYNSYNPYGNFNSFHRSQGAWW